MNDDPTKGYLPTPHGYERTHTEQVRLSEVRILIEGIGDNDGEVYQIRGNVEPNTFQIHKFEEIHRKNPLKLFGKRAYGILLAAMFTEDKRNNDSLWTVSMPGEREL